MGQEEPKEQDAAPAPDESAIPKTVLLKETKSLEQGDSKGPLSNEIVHTTNDPSEKSANDQQTIASAKDRASIVRSVEQDLAAANTKSGKKSSFDDGSRVLPAPALLPSGANGGVSRPGAWGVQPTRRMTSNTLDDDYDEEGGENSSHSSFSRQHTTEGDNETSAAYVGDELLIKAELVDERASKDDSKTQMVDAQIWDPNYDEEPAVKRRRRRFRYMVGLVIFILVLALVISLALTLTQNDDGDEAGIAQAQIVLASTSPTISTAPSRSPSTIPSSHPSDSPSQAPTQTIWQEVQKLDGRMIAPRPGLVYRGGEEFGSTVHISEIADTPLGNRTGNDFLVVGSYADVSEIDDGGLLALSASSAIFLCGGEQQRAEEEFCQLQTILPAASDTIASSLAGTYLVISTRNSDIELFDLSNVDSYNRTSVPNPLVTQTARINMQNVDVSDDASRIIATAWTEQLTIFLGSLPPGAPLGVLFMGAQPLFDVKNSFYSTVLRGSKLITIVGESDDPPPTTCVSPVVACDSFLYDRFIIFVKDIFDPLSLNVPPLEAGEGTSVFSHTGLAANGDASIVAVSSGIVSLGITVDFQVNIFKLVNSTTWEPMGSTIFGPNPNDYFGEALALNEEGDFLVVGAPSDATQGVDSGRVYSFTWDGEDWVPFGDPLEGTASSKFGSSLDLSTDGGLLVVGSPENDINGENSGMVTLYELTGI